MIAMTIDDANSFKPKPVTARVVRADRAAKLKRGRNAERRRSIKDVLREQSSCLSTTWNLVRR